MSNCIIWTGYVTSSGYGRTGQGKLAHRQALSASLGRPIKEGLWVLHQETCPKLCVNPEHLTEDTPSANALSAWESGKCKRAVPRESILRALEAHRSGLSLGAAARMVGRCSDWLAQRIRRGRTHENEQR